MDLEKAYPSQLNTLRILFEAKGKDLIAGKLTPQLHFQDCRG